MQKLIAVIYKELLLLWRDKAGLLVLFVMPAFLVVIITLVQENVLKVMGEGNINILFIDKDKDDTGSAIKEQLNGLTNVTLVEGIDGVQLTRQNALDLISSGKYTLVSLDGSCNGQPHTGITRSAFYYRSSGVNVASLFCIF